MNNPLRMNQETWDMLKVKYLSRITPETQNIYATLFGAPVEIDEAVPTGKFCPVRRIKPVTSYEFFECSLSRENFLNIPEPV